MSYPKPLSEKTIENPYKELGLSDTQYNFLDKLFKAAANLYGAIELLLNMELTNMMKSLKIKIDLKR